MSHDALRQYLKAIMPGRFVTRTSTVGCTLNDMTEFISTGSRMDEEKEIQLGFPPN